MLIPLLLFALTAPAQSRFWLELIGVFVLIALVWGLLELWLEPPKKGREDVKKAIEDTLGPDLAAIKGELKAVNAKLDRMSEKQDAAIQRRPNPSPSDEVQG